MAQTSGPKVLRLHLSPVPTFLICTRNVRCHLTVMIIWKLKHLLRAFTISMEFCFFPCVPHCNPWGLQRFLFHTLFIGLLSSFLSFLFSPCPFFLWLFLLLAPCNTLQDHDAPGCQLFEIIWQPPFFFCFFFLFLPCNPFKDPLTSSQGFSSPGHSQGFCSVGFSFFPFYWFLLLVFSFSPCYLLKGSKRFRGRDWPFP